MVDNDDVEEEEEDEIQVNDNESKMMKEKVVKNNKSRWNPVISKSVKVS